MRAEAREAFERGRAPAVVAEETAVDATLPEGPSPTPPPDLPPEREVWPWLLVLLLLVLGGVAAVFFATRAGGNSAGGSSAGGAPATRTVPHTTPQAVLTSAQTTPTEATPRTPGRTAITLPRMIGLPAPTALRTLRRLGLVASTHGVVSTEPPNQVVSQAPGASQKLAKGATVVLNVSRGPRTVPVPDVVGQSVSSALATMNAQGLEARPVRVPSKEPAGRVVAQHPKAAARARVGSVIRLNLSDGSAAATTRETTSTAAGTTTARAARAAPSAPATSAAVPDLTGLDLADARARLRRVGLVIEIRKVPNALPPGTIVAQSRPVGAKLRRGDHVLVTVSLGGSQAPQAATVPDVVGEDEATATADLQGAGFSVQVVDRETVDSAEDGLVIDQTPAGGRSAPGRSTVSIYIGRYSG